MNQQEADACYRASNADEWLADLQQLSDMHQSSVLYKIADEAEAGSDRNTLLGFIAAIARGRVNQSDSRKSYDPFVFPGGRSLPPEEFTDDDVEMVRGVCGATTFAPLRARLLDVLWLSRRDRHSCHEAVQEYLAAGDLIIGSFVNRVRFYRRALGLARSMGWQSAIYLSTLDAICTRTRAIATDFPNGFFFCQMTEVVLHQTADRAEEFVEPALLRARTALAASDFRTAEQYFGVVERIYQRRANQAARTAVHQELAECDIAHATFHANATPPSYMIAARYLTKAVEQLIRLRADETRLAGLRATLVTYEERSLEELVPIVFPEELATQAEAEQEHNAEAVRRAVSGRDFESASHVLATAIPLKSARRARTSTEAILNQGILQTLMPTSHLDTRGRVVTVTAGLEGNAEQREEALLSRMYADAAQFSWSARSIYLVAGAEQIFLEHAPTYEDVFRMLRQSPYIVRGHEEIVVRGLLAGFYGEWLVAAHLLVPQFETLLRNSLERAGAVIANIEDGVTEDKTLKALLDRPECVGLLGEDLLFELRGILIEKSGFNFRNSLAHGMLNSSQFYSAPSVNSWWLMLRMCLAPWIR